MVIDELVEILRFDFDDKDLKAFDKGVKDATKALVAVGAAAVAAGAAIFAFVENVADGTDEMGKQAQRIGITVEAYQELAHAAELNGSSQASLASSLIGVAKAASEAARGTGPGIEAFGILGVSAADAAGNVKDADDLLLDIADSLENVSSQAEKIELLSKLGISEDMILTLDQGSEAIRRQMIEARQLGAVLSGEAAKASADFNDELLRVTKAAKGIANQLAVGLMPQITEMLKAFKAWFAANKAVIQQNLQRFLESLTRTITAVFNIGMRVISVINAIAEGMGGWRQMIILAAGAWTILNASMLILPVLAIAAATALFLLIEDVVTFANGGDSALGLLLEKFPQIEEAANGLNNIFISIRDTILEAVDGIASIINMIPGVNISRLQFGGGNMTPSAPQAFNINPTAPNVTANITVNAGGATGTEAKVIAISVRDEINKVMDEQNATAVRNLSGVVAQ